jgi:hypothetical protein
MPFFFVINKCSSLTASNWRKCKWWKSQSVILNFRWFSFALHYNSNKLERMCNPCADSSSRSMYTFRLPTNQMVIISRRRDTPAPPWSWDVSLDEFGVVIDGARPGARDLAPILLGHLIEGLTFAPPTHKEHILSLIWGRGQKRGGSA